MPATRYLATCLSTAAAVLALGLAPLAAHAQSRPLNDTGITWSGDGSNPNANACHPTDPAAQDCHYGRDARAAAGALPKLGASALNNGIKNGFDYSKISNAGQPLSANATRGPGANDWACTRDNVTGLVWALKTTSGLRAVNNTYTWYNPLSPHGHVGVADGGSCPVAGHCDVWHFIADVNGMGLCGHHDWRMPTVAELESIVDYGRGQPSIDPLYFPNTPSGIAAAQSGFWTSYGYVNDYTQAWYVSFYAGSSYYASRSTAMHARLVRGGL